MSEIGFGAWGIGGDADGAASYGPTDDRESLRALRRAFDLGVTFYDTADIYGFGHSERLIGEALRDVRSRIHIATKVGFLGSYGPQDFSPSHIRASLDASLRRLRTDYVDLYQLHNPPPDLLTADPRVVETLRDLVWAGKIRAYGASLASPDQGVSVLRSVAFQALQVNLSMVDQRAVVNGLLDFCAARGVGVIARTPLCFGFLTGKYATEADFAEHDHRARWPAQQIAQWARAPRIFAEVVAHADETPAQTALRFCLSYPSVATVIPGMLTTCHVDENTHASPLGPLPDAERTAVEAIYRRHEFFVAKASPTER